MGHTPVAVKQLLAGFETERAKQAFVREVEVWYRLRHPHVLELYGASMTVNPPIMISPFMKNGNFLTVCVNELTYVSAVLSLTLQLLSGLVR